MTTALIDGDLVVYMACAALQIDVDIDGDGDVSTFPRAAEAVDEARSIVRNWTKGARCDRAVICWSTYPNFRPSIFADYKKGRRDKKRPEALQEVRAVLDRENKTATYPGLEGDDVMGVLATSMKNTVIVSRDKDMETIPATVFNPDRDKRPRRILPAVAEQNWMRQTMTGDTCDSIPGIPGVGPKAATEIISNPHRLISFPYTFRKGKRAGQTETRWREGPPCSIWEAMVDRAAKAGMTEADLVLQAQLTRILRAEDYDRERGVIKLWTPHGKKELAVDALGD